MVLQREIIKFIDIFSAMAGFWYEMIGVNEGWGCSDSVGLGLCGLAS